MSTIKNVDKEKLEEELKNIGEKPFEALSAFEKSFYTCNRIEYPETAEHQKLVHIIDSINCIMCSYIEHCKNCSECNSLFFSTFCKLCSYSRELHYCIECQKSRECTECIRCFNSRNCSRSRDLFFCEECEECECCLYCSGLKNKSFCRKNIQYEEEDFLRRNRKANDLLNKYDAKRLRKEKALDKFEGEKLEKLEAELLKADNEINEKVEKIWALN